MKMRLTIQTCIRLALSLSLSLLMAILKWLEGLNQRHQKQTWYPVSDTGSSRCHCRSSPCAVSRLPRLSRCLRTRHWGQNFTATACNMSQNVSGTQVKVNWYRYQNYRVYMRFPFLHLYGCLEKSRYLTQKYWVRKVLQELCQLNMSSHKAGI